ncbi:interaptin-like isoform X1 [Olea europaea subsp. europaea]|uniref:Interaptin-like isoform X1 n=2 Tax=Olea europaea subsp. europaea TaxID=158383 RepID=A0A8S0QTW6_OLEEU|nr:interaptin-like isoform X1 [Olea europaea subsp. europaea]
MDEKGVSGSFVVISKENSDSLCPMFFGVSCAFFALRLLPEPDMCDHKWSEIRNRMLQGSAHLLGLLVWRVQREEVESGKSKLLHKLEAAKKEAEELKKIRSEDAKANEKVVSIFAAQEQTWFNERKKLRQQIGALVNELRVLETEKDKTISELKGKLQENEVLMQSKDKSVEEKETRSRELEENLKKAENLVEELRAAVKREAQLHSNEISKHKTAFIELVSNQRQLEAEMGRALRQVKVVKQELDSVLEQKEKSILMTQKLSLELVKLRKDLEQKDQILSAMLRKSKLDTAEKRMLLEEVKLSKSKRKQLELETARWKEVSESRHERNSLRNMLSKHVNSKSDIHSVGKVVHSKATMLLDIGKPRSEKTDFLSEYNQPNFRKGPEAFSPVSEPHSTDGSEEQKFTTDILHLENWVQSESEKCKIAIQERHHIEMDAFAEQLRLKDKKIEALRWHLLSMELESKRFQSHVEGLDHELARLRQDNPKLEARLLNREAELHSLKEKLALLSNSPDFQKTKFNSSLHKGAESRDPVWSKVKIIKRKPGKKEQETKMKPEAISQAVAVEEENETSENRYLKDIVLTLESPQKEIKEGEVAAFSKDILSAETSTSIGQGIGTKTNPSWKVDLHALGVSYKIKRLKQQLLMLERLTGNQESCENGESNNDIQFGIKGFYALMSFLNKQVDRYQSLQGNTDDICKRMQESALDFNGGSSKIARTEEETKRLELFLEETFKLQRYIVATGQRLMQVQTKIASGFERDIEEIEKPANFDMKRFADTIKTLFREVQRGIEVGISRLIGDLEGTLACDSIVHFQK